MNSLVIDRSTATQSVAIVKEGHITQRVLPGHDVRAGDWVIRVTEIMQECGLTFADLDEIVVGQGPGSFAGIRAALAFAQGIAVGGKAQVKGLASPIALTREGTHTAVIGDARRGLFWIAIYEGLSMQGDFKLATKETLAKMVPEHFAVLTSDGERIGPMLESIFGHHYKGNLTPLAGRLAEIALARPDLMKAEPLPIYLQGAVRDAPKNTAAGVNA